MHPGHRRKGIARALTVSILSELVGTVVLNVARHNTAARQLYESLGFTVEKEFTGNFNGYPSLAMTLRLEM